MDLGVTKIKICGLTRKEDIAAVNELRPDYIGFVFAPSRRRVSVRQAEELSRELDPAICPAGVFVNEEADRIVRIVKRGIIRIVQLHGQESPEMVRDLKERLAPWKIPVIKAVRMDSADALVPWNASAADYLLLDSGTGGTGSQFDHSLIEMAGSVPKPWFLAGGMNPENVAAAIERFAPYAVDVSSGVETDGRKDPQKIKQMIRAVRGAQNRC